MGLDRKLQGFYKSSECPPIRNEFSPCLHQQLHILLGIWALELVAWLVLKKKIKRKEVIFRGGRNRNGRQRLFSNLPLPLFGKKKAKKLFTLEKSLAIYRIYPHSIHEHTEIADKFWKRVSCYSWPFLHKQNTTLLHNAMMGNGRGSILGQAKFATHIVHQKGAFTLV